MFKTKRTSLLLLAISTALSSCAVPQFDVPHDNGVPTIKTIVDRIECELVSLIKNESSFKPALLIGDYVTAMNLTLLVNDTGALTPNLRFPTVGSNLSINAGLNYTNSRQHTFTRKLRYSFRELKAKLDRSQNEGGNYGECKPTKSFDLEGELGLKEFAALQFSAPSTSNSSLTEKGEFGGSITFTVTKNINSAGPTWVLSNFVGPGGLVRVQRRSENKIDISFARGSTEQDFTTKATATDITAADDFLTELLILQNE